jgi:Fe-S-cluster containining protein
LTVEETLQWLRDGHEVQLLCDAVPWPDEPEPGDLRAAHRKRRSFAAMSGSMPTRVVAILAANLAGACPNLQPDLRCGIYERRPLVCRIYPAEINPFAQFDPAKKSCPPEAWTSDRPVFYRQGRIVDQVLRRDIEQSREADAQAIEVKRRLCRELQVNCAAVAHEGFIVYAPTPALLLAALNRAVADRNTGCAEDPWRFVSNRAETIGALSQRGASAALMNAGKHPSFEYLEFPATYVEP